MNHKNESVPSLLSDVLKEFVKNTQTIKEEFKESIVDADLESVSEQLKQQKRWERIHLVGMLLPMFREEINHSSITRRSKEVIRHTVELVDAVIDEINRIEKK